MDSESINYSIEEGRWYDIRLEVSPLTIKGYIDGKLVQQASLSDKNRKTICASAQKDLHSRLRQQFSRRQAAWTKTVLTIPLR